MVKISHKIGDFEQHDENWINIDKFSETQCSPKRP